MTRQNDNHSPGPWPALLRLVPSRRLRGWNKSHTVYVRIRSVHVYTSSPSQVSDSQRQFNIHNYESVYDKTNKMTCAQRILGSTWASAQSDESFRCPRKESFGPWLCQGWFESSLGAQVILLVLSCGGSYMSHVRTKPAFGVCDQLRHKPACSATETGLGLEISAIASRSIVLSRQKQQKRWSYCADAHADQVFEISTSPIARH